MRILFITGSALHPPITGGRQRSNLLFRALREFADVDTFWIRRESITDAGDLRILREQYNVVGEACPQELSALGPWKFLRSIRSAWANRLANFTNPANLYTATHPLVRAELDRTCNPANYDWVVGRYLYSLTTTNMLGVRPTILDVDDLDSALIQTRLANGAEDGLRRSMSSRALRILQRLEPVQLQQCRHVWVSKAADVPRIGHERVSVLPNIPFVRPGGTEPVDLPMPFDPQSRILMTVGMLNHVPNIQGIDDFITHAWPRILQQAPGAEYHIVGSKLEAPERQRWASAAGVKVIGFVDDIHAAYARCAATVCPIPWGGGTNIKVVESMAYERPAIISIMAHRGWEDVFKHGESLFVAKDPAEFAQFGASLLLHPELRQKMGAKGREIARRNYSFASFCRTVREAIG